MIYHMVNECMNNDSITEKVLTGVGQWLLPEGNVELMAAVCSGQGGGQQLVYKRTLSEGIHNQDFPANITLMSANYHTRLHIKGSSNVSPLHMAGHFGYRGQYRTTGTTLPVCVVCSAATLNILDVDLDVDPPDLKCKSYQLCYRRLNSVVQVDKHLKCHETTLLLTAVYMQSRQ